MNRPARRHADYDPVRAANPADGRALVDTLLSRAVERKPLRFAPGQANSGATLEAVILDDETRLVVKRFSPETDLLMRLTHDAGRAAMLWTTGVFDRLPPVVNHATLAVAQEDDGWILVMRDVGEAIVGWDRILTREERRQLLSATAAMHAALAGERIPGLCPAIDWMTFMTPPVLEPLRGDPDSLPAWALRGWEAFFEAAPADVAGAIAGLHADPAPLAAQLERCEPTLVHGDLSGDNFGLFPDRVVVLDWGAATNGPAALEVTAFLANCRWHAGPDADEVIADARAAAGERHDERALQLAFLATFANYGWLHADGAVNKPDPERRRLEQVCFDWWIDRVRHALDSTWSPV
jgi:aminoglycoside phosphotransferase (APT) family kinase protein